MAGDQQQRPHAGAGAAYLALDWGTTHRRSFVMSAEGGVLTTLRQPRGVAVIAPGGFPAEAAALRAELGDLPMICAGMVGSTRGWIEAPYAPAPVGLADLAARLTQAPGADAAIVAGVSITREGRADVMRGEETLVLGAVAAGLSPPEALFCQPGTHAKWVRVAGGRIVDFATAMTGEVFALLRDHSLLRDMLGGHVADGPAFRQGVREGAATRDLLGALFGVRAAVLLAKRPLAEATAHASGLLIGADVGARAIAQAGVVQLVADEKLGALYAAAIDEVGGRSVVIDSDTAFVAGIHRIRSLAA